MSERRDEVRGKRISGIYNLAVMGLKSFFEAAETPSKDSDLDTPSRSNYP